MQVDDMGATATAIRNLEAIDAKFEEGELPTQDERGHLRNAIALLRTLHGERRELIRERAMVRRSVERERLPDDRASVTRKFVLKGAGENGEELRIYATLGKYADGRPGEVFLRCDKQGSLLSGAFDAVSLSISIGLQYGVPLSVYTDKLVGSRFEPAGFTGDKKYPMCTSILDLVARWLKDASA